MGRASGPGWRELTVRNRIFSQFGRINHGEHDPLWAQIKGFLGPRGGGLRDTEDCGGVGSSERVEARERVGDTAIAMFHVDDDIVVASEASDLGEGGGEGEEEKAVEGVTVTEAGFEVRWGGEGGGGGGDGVVGEGRIEKGRGFGE
ncbi:hypothetical protein Lal_00031226 [Lupinus albus]|nr:hypothetical protein Lal_00031226 [Lupinus albus]